MNEILLKRIAKEAHQYIQSDAVEPENMQLAFGDFINGAMWAFTPEAYDWLNKKMFDYRGLIPKGLAIEAPEGMYNN